MERFCNIHDLAELDGPARSALLRRAETEIESLLPAVAKIVDAVRQEGDAALVRFAGDYDRVAVDPAAIKAGPQEFDAAFKSLDADVIAAIEFAIGNIRTFHETQRPAAMKLTEVRPGAFAGDRFTAISSVALYVPRGKGSFPSVTMMTSVPAVIAGVKKIAIVTPPAPGGGVDTATLVAARLAGVDTVYKCGGAQAVAAIAYGTETVQPAIKIAGPGSPWVAAARRLLAGVIDTGLPAGPSEAIIFADGSLDGRLAALDLLIEAEHGPDSSAYLVTHDRELATAAHDALPDLWAAMTPQRAEFSRAVLQGGRGGIVVTRSVAESYEFINDYAPEHLEIQSTDGFRHLDHITEAAEILIGPHTPVTLANFVLGPNAVLPTGRWARSCGPLSVQDFLKRSSIGHVTSGAYGELAHHARVLARYEGFSSHENAISGIRDEFLHGSKG
jgi:histidinol dehydrogenase